MRELANERVVHTRGEAIRLIRKGTHRLHIQFDKGSIMSVLTSSQCDITSYQRAMNGLAIAYQATDKALLSAPQYCPAELEAYEPRLPLLLSDLSAMHVGGLTNEAPELHPPVSLAAYLGMRYVVEGAQLGRRVIERNLAQADIDSGIQNAKRFWTTPLGSKQCWPVLLGQLNNLQDRREFAQAIRAARNTFRYFLHSMMSV